jgi:hypothetical protein
MIRKPTEKMPAKKFAVLLYGIPGMGKSTLGLSAPKPLWVDTDKGIDRVSPPHRTAYIQPDSYQEILDDLKPDNPDLTAFETIVFDTGGTLFDFMSDWIIRRNPKAGKSNGALSLQGFGEVAMEFKRLSDYVRRVLLKHLVIVFHAKEDRDGDTPKWRPDVPGSTKNEVWKPVDLGGFMQAQNGKRTVSFFAMDERYLAKGNRSVNEVMEVPELARGRANDFLSTVFDRLNKAESDNASELEAYQEVMDRATAMIGQVDDAATANKAFETIKGLTHVFSSKDETWKLLSDKALTLGLRYDKGVGGFA